MAPWRKTKRLGLGLPGQQEPFVRWQQLLSFQDEPSPKPRSLLPPVEWQGGTHPSGLRTDRDIVNDTAAEIPLVGRVEEQRCGCVSEAFGAV